MKLELIEGWKKAGRFWSVRLSALVVIIATAEPLLPQLQAMLPPQWYAWAALAVAVSRVIKQKDSAS